MMGMGISKDDGMYGKGRGVQGSRESRRGAGAEVAPPTDMSYFNSGPSGGGNSRQGFRSHHDMADAFAAGLQANRK